LAVSSEILQKLWLLKSGEFNGRAKIWDRIYNPYFLLYLPK